MIRKTDARSDQNARSLLQKAIRRGAYEVAELAVVRLIQNKEVSWLKNRLAVIAFEESWGSVASLELVGGEDGLIRQYVNLAKASKNKDAAGLGSLAYELSNGQQSVLVKDSVQDRHIKVIAEAIRRPLDFWRWIKSASVKEDTMCLVNNAEIGYRLAGWPWDKAFAQASAYLSVCDVIPDVYVQNADGGLEFPYWVAIDKHTASGKRALMKCAEKFGIDKDSLGWIQFYLESAKCAGLPSCYWWEREKKWRLEKEGFSLERAEVVWRDASEYIMGLVSASELRMIEDLNSSFSMYQSTMNKQDKLI
jgi:hypothetical protein